LIALLLIDPRPEISPTKKPQDFKNPAAFPRRSGFLYTQSKREARSSLGETTMSRRPGLIFSLPTDPE
jgi:hypothetical protein